MVSVLVAVSALLTPRCVSKASRLICFLSLCQVSNSTTDNATSPLETRLRHSEARTEVAEEQEEQRDRATAAYCCICFRVFQSPHPVEQVTGSHQTVDETLF